jgi:hypothetical protein
MNISHHNACMDIKKFFINRFFSCYTSFSPSDPKNTSPPSTSYSPIVKHHFLSLFWLSSPEETNFLQLGYKIDFDALERISPHLGNDSTAWMMVPKNTPSAFDDFAINACCF